MKSFLFITTFLLYFLISICTSCQPQSPNSTHHPDSTSSTNSTTPPKLFPSDWQFLQRAYPHGTIDPNVYATARLYREEKISGQHQHPRDRFDNPWTFAGPTNIGGRVTDIERTTGLASRLYVCAASGGIFRSDDDGQTWESIFDEAFNLSIGDIAIAPSDQSIIYAGTGEPNAGGGSIAYDGYGVYKSTNGGDDWTHIGLEKTGSISKMIVHPQNSDECYAAAMGLLFMKNEDRGIYKSTDGGVTWNQSLFINDSTGIIDLVMHPRHPDTLFAAAWERTKRPDRRRYGGPSSGIYRTYDGGDTWTRLSTDLPESAGRIGLAISPSDPEIIAAYIVNDQNDFLHSIRRSEDGGDHWTALDITDIEQSPFMWWFGKIWFDPSDPQIMYTGSLDMYRSDDAGSNWRRVFFGAHVDQHALWINPDNPLEVYSGNDGGIYQSLNRGNNSQKLNGLPITQFYTCEIDYTIPQRLYGGTQDNSTMRTLTGNIHDWDIIFFGDGFRTLVDPVDNTYVYTEYQYGNIGRSIDGGETFLDATSGIAFGDRKNWNTPFILHPSDPTTLFYGANRLYKSTNRAVSWEVISPDLTGNPAQQNVVYGTITSITVSPVNSEIIIAGTDNGKVQITPDGGSTWSDVSNGLPNRWVTSVTSHPFLENVAYVTLSGYRYGTNEGHIYKTTNLGQSWADISGDFPDIPVNDLVIIPQTGTLCIATDIGVYYSNDDGSTWALLGTGLPNLVITDISYHDQEQFLIAASYGRGLYKVDLRELVSIAENPFRNNSLSIFPNPFSTTVKIEFSAPDAGTYDLDIFHVTGQKMITHRIASGQPGKRYITINTSGWSTGIYQVAIRELDGKSIFTGMAIRL